MIGKRTKIIFVIAVILTVVVSGAVWFMNYEINRLGLIVDEQVELISNTLAQEQKYNELEKLVDQTTDTRNELETFVLKESDTINFLADIESIGVDQGVSLEIASLSEVESKEGNLYKTLKLNIVMEGEADRLFKMLNIFEVLPYHNEIMTYEFNAAEGDGLAKTNVTLAVSLIEGV